MSLITHALWSLNRAGAERVVLDVCANLVKQGHRVRVITMQGGGAMEKDFREAGIEVALGPQTNDRSKLLEFLKKEFTAHRPDILHTHLGADLWAGYVAWKIKIPHVFATLHNEDRGLSWLYHQARRWSYRRMKKVICVSDAVKQFAHAQYGLAEQHLQVINIGVHVEQLHERGHQPFYDVPRLITAGRLTAQKDHRTLLRALARLHRPWQLDFCGAGELEQALVREATDLGILPKVNFAGSVTNLPERLARADLFCFPSRWEGQGLALLEAAGSGLPCLASDLPVFREHFDEASMFFARAGSDLDWAEKLDHILSNPREALARADQARAIVFKDFTVEKMVNAYLELYRQYL